MLPFELDLPYFIWLIMPARLLLAMEWVEEEPGRTWKGRNGRKRDEGGGRSRLLLLRPRVPTLVSKYFSFTF